MDLTGTKVCLCKAAHRVYINGGGKNQSLPVVILSGLRDKQLLVEMISSACSVRVLQSQSSITSFQNGPLRIYDDAQSSTSEETHITVHTDIAFTPFHCKMVNLIPKIDHISYNSVPNPRVMPTCSRQHMFSQDFKCINKYFLKVMDIFIQHKLLEIRALPTVHFWRKMITVADYRLIKTFFSRAQ